MLYDLILEAMKEQSENNRKAIHNLNCSLNEIQPYENQAFLKLLSATPKK